MNESVMRQLEDEELDVLILAAAAKCTNFIGATSGGQVQMFVKAVTGIEPQPIAECRQQFDRWAMLLSEKFRRVAQKAGAMPPGGKT